MNASSHYSLRHTSTLSRIRAEFVRSSSNGMILCGVGPSAPDDVFAVQFAVSV